MPVAKLDIRLLGGFALSFAGSPPVAIRSPRQQSFLAWLLLHAGEPQSRSRIAATLWPDATETQARSNLRKLLHDLRNAWPEVDGWIASGRDAVTWVRHGPYTLDVEVFKECANSAGDLAALREAISIYAGDLLPECYDEWILPHRDRLQRSFAGLLEQGLSAAEKSRDYAAAMSYAVRLLRKSLFGRTYIYLCYAFTQWPETERARYASTMHALRFSSRSLGSIQAVR